MCGQNQKNFPNKSNYDSSSLNSPKYRKKGFGKMNLFIIMWWLCLLISGCGSQPMKQQSDIAKSNTINSTEKLVVTHHDEAKYSVKIPVLLRTDFKPDQFNQAVDLSDVKTNPNNPNEIVSFRIQNIAVFPKED